MRPGETIDGRFTIERLAGSGGMGEVYRARDPAGAVVAVKVLRHVIGEARFRREAEVLAALSLPGIVRYVAHGIANGQPYLVTEWLEGETLADRVDRGPLTIAETIDLGARVARALAAVHRVGVIHRDLKPSNLFLTGGEIAGVTILDFGIARIADLGRDLTATGTALGTVGYMAPEQARGARDVDARADLFALGVVLWKCLAGEGPFAGADALAVMLKAALEDPPPLRDFRADVPDALDLLLASMMAKARSERPEDAESVAAALVDLIAEEDEASIDRLPPTLTVVEQRVMSVVLAGSAARSFADLTTQSHVVWGTADAVAAAPTKALEAAVERSGGRGHFLGDGSVLITMTDAGTATDLALRAVRAALSIRPFTAGAPIAVVSGRGVLSPRLPLGDLIDRAAALLRVQIDDQVRIDPATANLIGPAFETAVEDSGAAIGLRGEREDDAAVARTLLGRPAMFVGRDREIAMLEGLFAECEAESVARAALVTGEPGMGKSRLASALISRLRQRAPGLEVWAARGDPMRARSAFAMLGGLIQRAVGLSGATPREARHDVLHGRVRALMAGRDADLVAELLGEIADAPAPERSARIRALESDPLSLGEQIRRAAEALLAAACAARPVVVLLEDLHWGDPPTIAFVDAALRALSHLPLFVLALARPEVHTVFPSLWARRDVQVLPLGKLSPKAGERFVRQALGARLDDSAVRALVDRADGNAFFLEELIRAADEGRGAMPETIVATVQARLEAMEPGARQVLRAAGVFGATFWDGGVAALVGAQRAAEWLDVLAAREVISPPRAGRLAGEPEREFRHAIVQGAAYAMLTPRDRTLAHELAGAWLEAAGETEAAVLAEHFEQGGEPARAAAYFARAADRALRGNDLDAAVARADRGMRAAADPGQRAALVATLLETHGWRNDWAQGVGYADEVFAREPPGSRSWSMAALVKVWAAPLTGRLDGMVQAMVPLASVEPQAGAVSELVQALSAVVMALTVVSEHAGAATFLARMIHVAGPAAEADPVVRGWIAVCRGYTARQRDGDLATSLAQMEAARASFVEAGNPHQVAWADVHIGLDSWLLGDHEEAVRVARLSSRDMPSTGPLPVVASLGKLVLASALSDAGSLDAARVEARAMASAEQAQNNRFFEGMARSVLAEILHREGDLEAASREAAAAVDLLSTVPFDRAIALARWSGVRLSEGRVEEALSLARAATEALPRETGYADGLVHVALVDALLAAGETDRARTTLAEARLRLLARADALDAARRDGFLQRVPAHARLAALVEARLSPSGADP